MSIENVPCGSEGIRDINFDQIIKDTGKTAIKRNLDPRLQSETIRDRGRNGTEDEETCDVSCGDTCPQPCGDSQGTCENDYSCDESCPNPEDC